MPLSLHRWRRGRREALVPLRRASIAEMRPMRRRDSHVKPTMTAARTSTARMGIPTLQMVLGGVPR